MTWNVSSPEGKAVGFPDATILGGINLPMGIPKDCDPDFTNGVPGIAMENG